MTTYPRRPWTGRDSRECEAIAVLRAIIEGNDNELSAALERAKVLLRTKRGRPFGAPLRAVTRDQLRAIARLRADGKSHAAIAREMQLKVFTVTYHLQPSQAMQDALMEAAA